MMADDTGQEAGGEVEHKDKIKLHDLDLQIFCEIMSYLTNFPYLAIVSRQWSNILSSDTVYMNIMTSLQDASLGRTPFGGGSRRCRSHKELWEMTYGHYAWRNNVQNRLMVDFATSGVSNLSNDEGALSQIYYTFPRVGLQFKRKFALFSIACCTDLERIALKKGTHLGKEPCQEEAEYLVTGEASDKIMKLDFTTITVDTKGNVVNVGCAPGDSTHDAPGCSTVTNVVVWTSSAVELFSCRAEPHLTVFERRVKYSMVPVQRTGVLQTEDQFQHSEILIIHINEANIVSILSCGDDHEGQISVFNFHEGRFLFSTVVPGPIVGTSPATGKRSEWKSRERFEFKGSTQVGAIIDEEGHVHVFHFNTQTWCSIKPSLW
eukprot:Sspe_Gene.22485::Locus_8571_Transcript_1_2_Confidence_0.667_Length_1202::g.22485::m.22485